MSINMDEEREMCQNCKKDIPIVNYRTHTLHCARNMVKCRECEAMVGKADLENHRLEFHTLRLCSQCQVNVEAYKLPEHMKTLCSKRLLVCKFCNSDKSASQMTDHEHLCGVRSDRCDRCHEWVQLKEWDSHQSRFHGHVGRRFRERSVIANTNPTEDSSSYVLPRTDDQDNPMLPCEFCEGMIPMRKLLEHQAECVNPTNVRRSESINNLSQLSSSSSLSTYRPLSGIKNYSSASLKRSPPSLQRKISAPARYATLDRHLTETASHHSGSVTSQNGSTTRHTASQPEPSDDQNRYTSSQNRQMSSQINEEISNKLPCEFCNEPQQMENLMKHQRSCQQNPDSGDCSSCYDSSSSLRKSGTTSIVRNFGLNRTASVREARATTEDRTFGRSLSRQSSFTERSYSRRTDSIYTGGQLYTRGSLGLSRYNAGPDYAAATRRSALFDGYTGFAIYSSISQGLDEITYGGRRSRRNSVTESSYGMQRRGSVTGSAFEYSALVSAAVTANAMSSSSRYNSTSEAVCPTGSALLVRDSSDSVISSPKSSSTLSRQDSTRYSSSFCQSDSAYESSPSSSKPISTSSTSSTIVPPSVNSTESDGGVISRQESLRHSKSSKVERKVSFSGADPVVLESSPQKPKRIKEKSERKKKTDTSKHCDDLFDQVSAKLRALEQEQQEKLDPKEVGSFRAVPHSPLSLVPTSSLFPSTFSTSSSATKSLPKHAEVKIAPNPSTVNVSATVTLNGARSSVKVQEFESLETPTAPVYDVVSSKEESSRCQLETNPKTDPTNCEPANTIVLPSVSPQDVAASKCDVAVIRDKSLRESKSSSKRNSLDNKTVQTLAQDLAAECAKAYAMMENSLSKLSTDFAVGPFGLTPKKKTRKSRPPSAAPLK